MIGWDVSHAQRMADLVRNRIADDITDHVDRFLDFGLSRALGPLVQANGIPAQFGHEGFKDAIEGFRGIWVIWV